MPTDPPTHHAPVWLFSFVDLAFLLLLAMTQLAEDGVRIDLGELTLPQLRSEGVDALPPSASTRWQLRIHPPEAARTGETARAPFELYRGDAPAPSPRLALTQLRSELEQRRREVGRRPLLAPHEDSRSQDLLDAVQLIEDLWPRQRRTTVQLHTSE